MQAMAYHKHRPAGRVVTPCYVLNEYSGTQRVWETDLRKLWASIDWDSYRSCNKCALSCYLEPHSSHGATHPW